MLPYLVCNRTPKGYHIQYIGMLMKLCADDVFVRESFKHISAYCATGCRDMCSYVHIPLHPTAQYTWSRWWICTRSVTSLCVGQPRVQPRRNCFIFDLFL